MRCACAPGSRCPGPTSGAALVAVGGYGRSELAPYSDLDLVLVHDEQPDFDLGAVAGQVWYPLWDSGANLDHSVRTLAQMVETAGDDLQGRARAARRPARRRRPQPDPAAADHDAHASGGATPGSGCAPCGRWSTRGTS